VLKAYSINIVGLSNKIHHFDFEIGNDFFGHYGADLLQEGSFTAHVDLNKQETFIDADFTISGTAKLICDRSLETFDYPIKTHQKMVFKFGDEDQELTDEIVIINREAVTLELGQYMYEFIALAVPMKKLHPKFQDEDEEDDLAEGKIIYSSGEDKNDDDDIDPRWEQLKKLK
jgi:uncharacterized metal-binding protein YceD (DUF177 family)